MERVSFLGFNLPVEVRKALPLLARLDRAVFRALLDMVQRYLTGDDPPFAELELLAQSSNVGVPELAGVFTGVFYVLRAAARRKTPLDHFRTDLLDVKFPQPCIADLETVLRKSRAAMEAYSAESRIRFPALAGLKWRVDVVVSTSALNRALFPSLLLEMTTSDGAVKVFEVSHEKFHELRYNVARVLKDVEDLDQLQILKIDK